MIFLFKFLLEIKKLFPSLHVKDRRDYHKNDSQIDWVHTKKPILFHEEERRDFRVLSKKREDGGWGPKIPFSISVCIL